MPGISVSRIPIPFNKGGFSYSSYWATRNPSALIVTGMRDTEIDFSWTDNSAGEASFKIYKSTDGVTYAADGTTVAGDTTYTATGMTAGVLYYFYVVGVKSANESDPTNIYDTRFKITIDTTKTGSASDTFVLPTYTSGTYNYYVDWGDGSAEENVTTTTDPSHTYASGGVYQVRVRGTFPQIYFNNAGDKAKLLYIDNWGNIKWIRFATAFYGCVNMQGRYYDVPNMTAAPFNHSQMFRGCTSFNWDVNNFNMSTSVQIDSFFLGCTLFNKPLNNWNTSNVILMNSAINSCPAFNQDISNFNIENVTNLSNMFNGSNAWSRANYDAVLIAWAAQDVNNSLAFHAGDATYTAGGAAAAAHDHLTTTHSWTITDGGESFNNGKLVITSDDGNASIYTTGLPALVNQGIAATFYIVSDLVGTDLYVTWPQLVEMAAAGMDIQCHFNTHTDLRTLNEAQIVAGLQDCASDFTTNGLAAPVHHAYPYGYFNDNVRTWVAEERLTARTIINGYVHKNSDKTQLKTEPCDSGYIDIAEAMILLDHVKSEGKAVIMFGHGFGVIAHIDMDEINAIIDYAQSIGVDIITMSQLYALMT